MQDNFPGEENRQDADDIKIDNVTVTEGGITDLNNLAPLGGSSDVGGTGDQAATADIGASTGAAGLVAQQSGTSNQDEGGTGGLDTDELIDSDLLGGDIINSES
ncbi:MAG TPA: hypothetical protein VF600_06255 [Abditibacteriaceae bacterium]|jgi:hypothetical protein